MKKRAFEKFSRHFGTTKYKIDFTKTLPELIASKLVDYDVFFTTITFKDVLFNPQKQLYETFFERFRMRLDNQLLQSTYPDEIKPVLLLIPEKTHKATKMFSCTHYHGFLLVHKRTRKRFEEKCVTKVALEKTPKNGEKNCFHLNSRILNPYGIEEIQAVSSNSLLTIDDYKIFEIFNMSEIVAVSKYSGKDWTFSDFEFDDVILTSKPKPVLRKQ